MLRSRCCSLDTDEPFGRKKPAEEQKPPQAEGRAREAAAVQDAEGKLYLHAGLTGGDFLDDRRLALTLATRVLVVDAASGEELLTLHGHTANVSSGALSPDGKHIASGGWDGTARLWDAVTGKPLATFRGDGIVVNQVLFSPDGRRVVSAGGEGLQGEVKLWDVTTGQEAFTLRGHRRPVRGVAFTPAGRQLVTVGQEGVVKVWDGTPVE